MSRQKFVYNNKFNSVFVREVFVTDRDHRQENRDQIIQETVTYSK